MPVVPSRVLVGEDLLAGGVHAVDVVANQVVVAPDIPSLSDRHAAASGHELIVCVGDFLGLLAHRTLQVIAKRPLTLHFRAASRLTKPSEDSIFVPGMYGAKPAARLITSTASSAARPPSKQSETW